MEQVLFVFYKGEGSWSYNLPKDWWLVGAGSAPGLREEQFQGPKATKKKAKEYLDKFFKTLKKKSIVSMYKIRESYLP